MEDGISTLFSTKSTGEWRQFFVRPVIDYFFTHRYNSVYRRWKAYVFRPCNLVPYPVAEETKVLQSIYIHIKNIN